MIFRNGEGFWELADPRDVLDTIEGGLPQLEQELTIYRLQEINRALDRQERQALV